MSRIELPPLPAGAPCDLAAAMRAVRAGSSGPVELVEQCLGRIEAADGALRAWVEVDAEQARATAARQAALRREEARALPLLGIGIGVKDIVDVAGLPTRCGSPLREDHRAGRDAPVVAALRSLGAIVLGKTVTTQFACQDPSVTRNPWDLEHSPGGSSAGSAAATAAGMCFAALGTQTGGSITRPASFCGVASFKGAWKAWPLEGIHPVSEHLDHVGPHARRAGDLALLWALVESRLRPERAAAMNALVEAVLEERWLDGLAPPRFLAFDGYHEDVSDPQAWAGYRESLERLASAGAEISPAPLPPAFAGMHDAHRVVMAVEAAEVHREAFAARPEAYRPGITALIETGAATSAVDYRAALRHRDRFRAERAARLAPLAEEAIALTPATVAPAPPLAAETTGDPQFNAPWSFSGLPTCAVPASLGAGGLPLGLQLGAARESPRLFRAAGWCERVLGFPHLA